MSKDYLLYLAYHYFLLGEAFPVDVYVELVDHGFEPSELELQFHDGFYPAGFDLIAPESFLHDAVGYGEDEHDR